MMLRLMANERYAGLSESVPCNRKAEGSRRKAEGGRQKAEVRFSIFHFSFFICHFRSSLVINDK